MALGYEAWTEARRTLKVLLSANEGLLRDDVSLRSRSVCKESVGSEVPVVQRFPLSSSGHHFLCLWSDHAPKSVTSQQVVQISCYQIKPHLRPLFKTDFMALKKKIKKIVCYSFLLLYCKCIFYCIVSHKKIKRAFKFCRKQFLVDWKSQSCIWNLQKLFIYCWHFLETDYFIRGFYLSLSLQGIFPSECSHHASSCRHRWASLEG